MSARLAAARTTLLAALAACAPLSKHVVTHDRELARDTRRVGEPAEQLIAEATLEGDGLAIRVVAHATCSEHVIRRVHRIDVEERSVNKLVLVGELVLGFGAAGAGAVATQLPEPSAQTGGKLGIAVSVPFIVSAIIDAVRSRDREHDRGELELAIAGSEKTVACGDTPKPDIAVALKTAGGRTVALGTTGADGRLRVGWTAIPAELVTGPSWTHEADLVTGKKQTKLGTIDLAPARGAAAERAWAALEAAPTVKGYDAFAEQFPEAHTSELAGKRIEATAKQYAAAIAARDATAAADALATWRTLAPDDPGHAARDGEVAALANQNSHDEALGAATAAIESIEAGTAAAGTTPAADAEVALSKLGDAPEVGPLRERLAKARAVQGKLLVKRAEQELRAGRLREARATFALAIDIAPAKQNLARVRARFDRRVIAAAARAARHALRHDVERARALVAFVDENAPGAKAIEPVRAELARRDAAEKAEAERVAAEKAAADKAEAERVAAEKAAADKAEAERVAAEKAAEKVDAEHATPVSTDPAVAAKIAADRAAAAKAAADRAATATASPEHAAAKGGATIQRSQSAVVVPPTDGERTRAFTSGYIDEETCEPTRFERDPNNARPALGIAAAIGFGGGYAEGGVAGLMVGEAGVRYRFARAFGSLSGGTGLTTLDLAAGGDVVWGYERYTGLAVRGGYAHGWAVRGDGGFHELRADVGLAALKGVSWLGVRVRMSDAMDFDSFYLLVLVDRLR